MDIEKRIEDLEKRVSELECKNTRFVKPTIEQIREYAISIGFKTLNARKFVDFYESKGWLIGKSPMKSWQATVRTWMPDEPVRQEAKTFKQRIKGTIFDMGD